MALAQPAYFPRVPVERSLRRLHGVVEAVHYGPDGRVAWVRAYLRRFDNFSDRVRLTREDLVRRLQGGQRFRVGKPRPRLGNDFEVGPAVTLAQRAGEPFLTLEGAPSSEQELAGVPVL